jgi:hypothetical protein
MPVSRQSSQSRVFANSRIDTADVSLSVKPHHTANLHDSVGKGDVAAVFLDPGNRRGPDDIAVRRNVEGKSDSFFEVSRIRETAREKYLWECSEQLQARVVWPEYTGVEVQTQAQVAQGLSIRPLASYAPDSARGSVCSRK